MQKITTLFWDLGGVLLTNGWDTNSRRQAAEKFRLDWDEFQERHKRISTEFEKGQLSLREYLQQAVFYQPRDFCKESFEEFMFRQSQPQPEVLKIVERLAESSSYLMSTLNNESRELNQYRIETFHLRKYFSTFFSSGFLGVKKPEKEIYQVALDVTQKKPEECLFLDDRALNLETAARMGIQTLHFQNPEQLRQDLKRMGIQL